jgi:thiol-disulfide isomerase/thioredoxin
VTRDDFLASQLPLLLVFTSRGCGPCKAFLPEIAEWQRTHGERVTIAVASDGNADTARDEAHEFALAHVLIDQDLRIHRAFQANGTPSAVLLWPDATVGSYVAAGREATADLLARALRGERDAASVPALTPGMPVPPFKLPSLNGDSTSLADLREETVLLFWNPTCGFCQSMRQDLRQWEADSPRGAPRLVVVSSGDAESSRADGFASAVLLDHGSQVSAAFGAHGTPMAVRLDADGRMASTVAAGAAAVFALLGAAPRVDAGSPT